MKRVVVTMQDIWNASKNKIFKNKKKYIRKQKYKKIED